MKGSSPNTCPLKASRSCCERMDIPPRVVTVAVLTDATRLKRRRTFRRRRNSFHVSGRTLSEEEEAAEDDAVVEDVEGVECIEVGVVDVDARRVD